MTGLDLGSRLPKRILAAFRQTAPVKARLTIGRRIFQATASSLPDAAEPLVLIQFLDVTSIARAAARWKRTAERALLAGAYSAAALDSLSASIAVIDRTGVILAVNGQWRARAGESGGRNPGGNYLEFCATFGGDSAGQGLEAVHGMQAVLQGSIPAFSTEYLFPAHGQARWFRMVASPLLVHDQARGAVIAHFDITDEVRLLEEKARQLAALQSVANAIFITDTEGRLDWANEAFRRSCVFDAPELGVQPWLVGGPAFLDIIASCQQTRRAWSGQVVLPNRSGDSYTVEQTVMPVPDASGRISHLVVTQQNVMTHQEADLRIMYMAEHDDLTGLLNRQGLHDRLRIAIAQHRSMDRQLAVLFVSLDRFKDANEALGHCAGDRILVESARRLRSLLRDSDVLARFGGDEFVIVLHRCGGREQIASAVDRILAAFRRPIDASGHSVPLGASLGVASFPSDGSTHEALLRAAGLAMYRAKAEGCRGFRFYDPALEAEVGERVAIERELNGSLGTRALWIAYQPQWDIQTGRITGAEGLLRWNPAAERGIPMGRIVSIAEESGLILPIGQWVADKALAQLQTWRRQLDPALSLSINLSAVQLNQQDVSSLLTEDMRGGGRHGPALKVEITESVLLQNSSRVSGALEALHKAGVGLVLDDFGTGYSSLTHLQRFPIESVKIDISFVRGIGIRRQDEAIINGIVQLAHSLGLTVIAEGVETGVQLDFLKSVRCDSAQGFLVSPALPPAEFETFILNRNRADLSRNRPAPAKTRSLTGPLA